MSRDPKPYLQAIAERGYTVLPGEVPPAEVESILASMRRLHSERGQADDADQPMLNRGHAIVYNLQREDVLYPRMFTGNPLIMGILKGLLNDVWYKQIPQDQPNFILRSILGRSSGPGPLPLHIDSFIPSGGALCFTCQAALVLEDQTVERGCTVVVPGSHLSDRYADQAAMADAVPLQANAGDVVIWDSRLWHGALGNSTPLSRWSLIATFARWWIKQNYDMTGTLPQGIYDQLTDDEKAVFGFCYIPPRDERERADMKCGHMDLRPTVADYRRAG